MPSTCLTAGGRLARHCITYRRVRPPLAPRCSQRACIVTAAATTGSGRPQPDARAHAHAQATFYPNAYADCASGGASGQTYGLPDLSALAPDPVLPSRCQDPGALQASSAAYPGSAACPSRRTCMRAITTAAHEAKLAKYGLQRTAWRTLASTA